MARRSIEPVLVATLVITAATAGDVNPTPFVDRHWGRRSTIAVGFGRWHRRVGLRTAACLVAEMLLLLFELRPQRLDLLLQRCDSSLRHCRVTATAAITTTAAATHRTVAISRERVQLRRGQLSSHVIAGALQCPQVAPQVFDQFIVCFGLGEELLDVGLVLLEVRFQDLRRGQWRVRVIVGAWVIREAAAG